MRLRTDARAATGSADQTRFASAGAAPGGLHLQFLAISIIFGANIRCVHILLVIFVILHRKNERLFGGLVGKVRLVEDENGVFKIASTFYQVAKILSDF